MQEYQGRKTGKRLRCSVRQELNNALKTAVDSQMDTKLLRSQKSLHVLLVMAEHQGY